MAYGHRLLFVQLSGIKLMRLLEAMTVSKRWPLLPVRTWMSWRTCNPSMALCRGWDARMDTSEPGLR